jgi:hypothetical protein
MVLNTRRVMEDNAAISPGLPLKRQRKKTESKKDGVVAML